MTTKNDEEKDQTRSDQSGDPIADLRGVVHGELDECSVSFGRFTGSHFCSRGTRGCYLKHKAIPDMAGTEPRLTDDQVLIAEALGALESDATIEQREEAFDKLRDRWFPTRRPSQETR